MKTLKFQDKATLSKIEARVKTQDADVDKIKQMINELNKLEIQAKKISSMKSFATNTLKANIEFNIKKILNASNDLIEDIHNELIGLNK